MNRALFFFLLAPAVACAQGPSYAASTATLTLDMIASHFSGLDAKMQTLRADFSQFVKIEGSDTVQQVTGQILFKKPDLIHLTQSLPEKQNIVSDGVWLWVYRPSTNQVIQTNLKAWRNREPLAKGLLDLGHSADLLKRYDAALSTISAPDADGHRIFTITLTPKSSEHASDVKDFTLTLKVSTKDFFPYEAFLRAGRASIRSTFSKVELNPKLPDDSWRFSPPAGADVFTAPSSS